MTATPPRPTVGGSFRAALQDFFYNSGRLVGANLIWGLGLIVLVGLTFTNLPAALVALCLLALPTAGIFRLAAVIARGDPASFSDAIDGMRRFLIPALGTGIVVGLASVMLTFNIIIGFTSFDTIGVVFATSALWGLVALWAVALAFWPLLLDPRRETDSFGTKLRLAVAVILVAPGRYALLFLTVFVVIFASTIMFAALVTVSISFVALALCRYVLPAADRLEGMPAEVS